jgi:hypothetical protein
MPSDPYIVDLDRRVKALERRDARYGERFARLDKLYGEMQIEERQHRARIEDKVDLILNHLRQEKTR